MFVFECTELGWQSCKGMDYMGYCGNRRNDTREAYCVHNVAKRKKQRKVLDKNIQQTDLTEGIENNIDRNDRQSDFMLDRQRLENRSTTRRFA
jgi:hypothetical protein